jgi:Transposase DDE domain
VDERIHLIYHNHKNMLHLLCKLSTIKGRYQACVLKNLEMLISVILVSRTANLNKLKDDLPSVLELTGLKPTSYYKRLLRCVETCSKSRIWIDLLRWGLSHVWAQITTLHIDGTEWSFGKYPIHILVLSADFQGVAIPIFFIIYKHEGVLSEEKRIAFMKKALKYYALAGKILLADREFIGNNWFTFLNQSGVQFIIRLRKKMYKNQINDLGIAPDLYEKLIARALKRGYAQTMIKINDGTFRVEFWRNKHHEEAKKEPVIFLITNILDKKRVGKKYQQRWKIEYCFKHLKTNGFNIEDIGFKKIHKLQFLIAVIIVVYILAICKGMFVDKKNKTKSKWKNYKSGLITRATSIFRTGLFELKAAYYNLRLLTKFLHDLPVPKRQFLQIVQ